MVLQNILINFVSASLPNVENSILISGSWQGVQQRSQECLW